MLLRPPPTSPLSPMGPHASCIPHVAVGLSPQTPHPHGSPNPPNLVPAGSHPCVSPFLRVTSPSSPIPTFPYLWGSPIPHGSPQTLTIVVCPPPPHPHPTFHGVLMDRRFTANHPPKGDHKGSSIPKSPPLPDPPQQHRAPPAISPSVSCSLQTLISCHTIKAHSECQSVGAAQAGRC